MPIWLSPITGAITAGVSAVTLGVTTTFTTANAWVKSALTTASPYGERVWSGAKDALEDTKEKYDSVLEAMRNMPLWFRLPWIILSRLLVYVLTFFKSTIFIWAQLYTTVMFWFWLGLFMYPLLLMEESPDEVIEITDQILYVFLILWTAFSGFWNFSVDICKPLLPIWNIIWATLFEFAVMMVEVLEEVMSSRSTAFERRLEKILVENKAYQVIMGTYNRIAMSMVMFACRFYWIFVEIILLFAKMWLRFLATILMKIIFFISNLTKFFACCGSEPVCCMREIVQGLVNLLVWKINLPLKALASICILGVCPLGFLCCIPPVTFIGCTNGHLEQKGVSCTCRDVMYLNLKECPVCHFECLETETAYNWMKICEGDDDNPETIIEAGWCSHDPPEGLGPKPDVRRLTAIDSTWTMGLKMSDMVEEECYLTCQNRTLRRRCMQTEYLFEEIGYCPGYRQLKSVESHHNLDYSREWSRIEEKIRSHPEGDDLQCQEWLKLENDQEILQSNLKHLVREELCVASYGFDTKEAHKYFHTPPFSSDHISWMTDQSLSDHFYDPKLTQHMTSILDLTQKVHYHVSKANHIHTRSYNPQMHGPKQKHFIRHLNTHAISNAWEDFKQVNDKLMKHTGMNAHLQRIEEWNLSQLEQFHRRHLLLEKCCNDQDCSGENVGCVGSTINVAQGDEDSCNGECMYVVGGTNRKNKANAFNSANVRCGENEIKCPDRKTCIRPPTPEEKDEKGHTIPFQQCPEVSIETASSQFYSGLGGILSSLMRFDLISIFNIMLSCWKQRTSMENPYHPNQMANMKSSDWEYCFPQIDPETELYIGTSKWRLQKAVDDLCEEIKSARREKYKHSFGVNMQELDDQGCLCTEYYSKSVSEYNAKWFWFIPYYIKARLGNAILVTQFLISHYLTQDTIIDHLWTGFWQLFLPQHVNSHFIHWFGKRTDLPESFEWMCAILHLGSFVYIMFWAYMLFIFYSAFFSLFQIIYKDLFSLITFLSNYILNQCQHCFDPDDIPDDEENQIPGLFPNHISHNLSETINSKFHPKESLKESIPLGSMRANTSSLFPKKPLKKHH